MKVTTTATISSGASLAVGTGTLTLAPNASLTLAQGGKLISNHYSSLCDLLSGSHLKRFP